MTRVIPGLMLILCGCGWSDPVPQPGVYNDQSQFEAAAAGFGRVVTDNFGQGGIHLPGVSVSSDIPFDGPGTGEGNGHFATGGFEETTSKYSSTTWTFRDPVYGFGGMWDLISPRQGLQILAGDQVYFLSGGSPYGTGDEWSGFWGFLSQTPIRTVSIAVGDGERSNQFGQTYTFSDMDVVTATPEPGSWLLAVIGLGSGLLAMTMARRRQCDAG